MSPAQLHDIGGRRAWVIWLVALGVYVLAVLNRSSLAVAGLLAADRFGIVLDLREPAGATAYDLSDFRVARCVQYPFWIVGTVQILRYRGKAVTHLDRTHPGAVERLKAGEVVVPTSDVTGHEKPEGRADG